MIEQVIHVLSIEDNPAEAMLIQKQLAEAQRVGWDLPRFAVKHVDCLETALARLDGGEEFDVVLSDLDLPDSQAGETVATLREHIPHMPLVVLTGREDETLAHKSVRAGVQDYLYKNEATGSLLARSMMYAIERQQAHTKLEQRVEERTSDLRAEITERKRAEEKIRQRNRELAALNAITVAISQSLDLEEVLDTALEETLAALDIEGGLIYLFDEAEQIFNPVAHRGVSSGMLEELTGFELGQGLSGRAAMDGEPVMVSDLCANARNLSPTAAEEGWRSFAAMPIKLKGDVLGVMSIIAYEEDRFKPEHVDLLSRIGNQVGVAIEKAELYRRAQDEIFKCIETEKALRASEAKYRYVVDNSLAGIFVVQDGGFTFVNARMAHIFGYERADEIVGLSFWELVHPDDREWVKKRGLRRERGEAVPENYEFRGLKKDGTGIWIEARATLAECKGHSAIVGNTINITARKRAEEARRASEAQYRLITQNTVDVIWTMDVEEQRFTYISPSVEWLRGYTPDEVMAQPVDAALTAESARKVAELLADRDGFPNSLRIPPTPFARWMKWINPTKTVLSSTPKSPRLSGSIPPGG